MENKRVLLASRPTGWVSEDNFRIDSVPVPKPRDGEVLVRNLWLSLDPYMRGRMNEGKSYAAKQELGEVMIGGTVGEVVESKNPKFAAGDKVLGMFGWQQYGLSDGKGLSKVDASRVPLSAYLGVLGMPGVTAWVGLLDICQPKAGETVVVSGAAGAVGMVVGQLAKIHGCRVIGTAGSDDKVAYLKKLGFDEAINYKTTPDINQAMAAAAPQGVDCYFDNVGGPISDAVYNLLNKHARIAICGQISMYNATSVPVGPRPEGKLLTTSSLMKGFIVSDYLPRWPEGVQQLGEWYRQGKLQFEETITEGFDQIPTAFLGLFEGDNTGKAVVKVAEPAAD
jgi:leukotriene B4 12-hydroxydehydrogenase/15-oxo-prostaglandin 13-reductase